jgi:hypothetical protein
MEAAYILPGGESILAATRQKAESDEQKFKRIPISNRVRLRFIEPRRLL